MTYKYLLDTNILSDFVRYPQGLVFQRIATVGANSVCTSMIVACELRFGAVKRGLDRLVQQLDRVFEFLPVLPLSPPVDQHHAVIRTHLEQAGTPIGPNDLPIATHAFAPTRLVQQIPVNLSLTLPALISDGDS